MVLLREFLSSNGSGAFNININDKNQVTKCFIQLYHEYLSNKNRSIEPRTFLKTFHDISRNKKMAIGMSPLGQQKDAHEFMISLLDLIHNEIREHKSFVGSKPNNQLYQQIVSAYSNHYKEGFSLVVPWIHGMYMSTVTCCVCGKESNTFDPFLGLTIELPTDSNVLPTLENCLDKHFATEVLDEDNGIKCDIHKGTNSTKRSTKKLSIWQPPEILIFIIKRFSTMIKPNGMIFPFKNNIPIIFPERLDISNYVCTPMNDIYTLNSVGNHHGNSLPSGHYTATVKKNGNWWNISDSMVSKGNQPFNSKNESAYVLIYSKS
jgi:ubiquitin carboxyl-terminal hydrolase 3